MKMKYIRYFVCLLIFALLCAGCHRKPGCIPSPDISSIKVDLKIERLDKELMNVDNPDDLGSLLKKHEIFSEIFLLKSQYPNDSIFRRSIYGLIKDPHIDTLEMEIDRVFGDFSDIRKDFEDAFKRIKYYYPDYKVPRIETVLSGMSKDMYVSDSLIVLGLDYYLGEGARYRPINIPNYMLKRYQRRNLVPNTFLFISEGFDKTDKNDHTLLADMLFYGKAFHFAKQMLPCVPDSVFLGYTPEEMKDIYASQEVIWANFIENQALYTTDENLKEKFISERPKTFEIGENCPGRIGRWIGWEIIKAFMDKNPDVKLPQLMADIHAQEIFVKSKFKPHNRNY